MEITEQRPLTNKVPVGFEAGLAVNPASSERARARMRKERHPFVSGRLLAEAIVFWPTVIAAVALVPLASPEELDLPAFVLAVVLAVLVSAATFACPWDRLPAWTRMLPPLSLLAIIGLLRQAVGTDGLGLAILLLIVPVWVALYEARGAVFVSAFGVAVTLLLPIYLEGPPEYPLDQQLRLAFVVTGMALFIGIAVQRPVENARDRESETVRSRRFLLAALSSAVEGVVAIDPLGHVAFANASAMRMLQLDESDLVGAKFSDVVQPVGRREEMGPVDRESQLQRALRTGEEVSVNDESFWRADGSSFPVIYNRAGFTDPGSGQRGAVLSFVDVSEERRSEKVKDELLSVVGHELRTPLTSIRGSLGLIAGGKAGELSPEADRMISIAITNTDRLARLINDILDIERIESGHVQMSRQICAVKGLTELAIETLMAQADAAGVKLVGETIEATLWADPDRILQALINLISNAIKFSPRDTTVTVSVVREGGDVRFEVADRGRGIPADKLEAVFERFGQVDASDSREKGGTGLGLPISRSIVHQHGGRIWIDSELGVGTTISFTVPALSAPPSRGPEADHEGPLVLLIEDDHDLADVLGAIFSDHGLGVWRAADAVEAVRLLNRRRPDLIVLDLVLPDADGGDLVRWMRKQPVLADVPLAVYTEKDLTDEMRENLRLGPSIHFTKSRMKPDEFAKRALDLVSPEQSASARSATTAARSTPTRASPSAPIR